MDKNKIYNSILACLCILLGGAHPVEHTWQKYENTNLE